MCWYVLQLLVKIHVIVILVDLYIVFLKTSSINPNEQIQIGILSNVYSCAIENVPVVSRVSHYYKKWITNTIEYGLYQSIQRIVVQYNNFVLVQGTLYVPVRIPG